MVLEQGLSASKVARDLKISQPSLSRWMKDSQQAAIPDAITNAQAGTHKREAESTSGHAHSLA